MKFSATPWAWQGKHLLLNPKKQVIYKKINGLMRIAINTRFLLPGKLEGLGWYTYEICRRWVAQHPEDEFYFLFDRPFDKAFLFGPNVHPVVVPPPARHPLLWYGWFEWSIPAVLKRIQPDVFFSPDGYLSLRSRVPVATVIHDLAFLHYPEQVPALVRAYYRYFTPRFIQRAERIITVSEFVKQDICAAYGAPEHKILAIPNGSRAGFQPCTPEVIQATRGSLSDGQPYFFYLGALHPRKNLPRLIRAYSMFRHATGAAVKLLIGGRMAWQTGEIQSSWEASPFREDIRFLGYLPEEDLPRILGSALALTYVSLFEGFGLPVLEAMHSEVPVITSNLASMPEVAGDAALLTDPEDEKSIAGAMRQIWEEPQLRLELIRRGRTQRSKFSWDTAAEQIYSALLEIAGT